MLHMREWLSRSRAAGMIPPPGLAAPLAAGLLAAAFLAACGGGSAGPLVANIQQKGAITCAPAPELDAGIGHWDTQVGFAQNYFYNQGSDPVTITSVSLIDTHGLILRSSVVYEMVHNMHPLIIAGPWASEARYAHPAEWLRRQSGPGAVIPPENSTIGAPGPHARNEYQIAADISAKTPHGGWTAGLQVTYRAGGQTYTVLAYIGYAIAPPPSSNRSFCQPYRNSIEKAWSKMN
jgi:hypothetical protein